MFSVVTVLISSCLLCVAVVLSILRAHEKQQRLVVRDFQRKLAMNGLLFDDLWKQGGVPIDPKPYSMLTIKRIEDKSFKSLRILPDKPEIKSIEDKNFRGLGEIKNES